MPMSPALRKRPAIPAALVVLAFVSSGIISCSTPNGGSSSASPQTSPYTLPADSYVTPRKIYPYDLKSAQNELAGKSVWVRPGSAHTYYRYSGAAANLDHKAGVLPTLGRLDVKDVVVAKLLIPISGVKIVRRQLLAVFSAPWQAGEYAVSIAAENADSYTFTVNDQFFFEDPHQLYAHWPADVWASIDHHQVKEGMNELQVSFALGPEVGSSGGDYGNRWVRYSDHGGVTKVVFRKDQAAEIIEESR